MEKRNLIFYAIKKLNLDFLEYTVKVLGVITFATGTFMCSSIKSMMKQYYGYCKIEIISFCMPSKIRWQSLLPVVKLKNWLMRLITKSRFDYGGKDSTKLFYWRISIRNLWQRFLHLSTRRNSHGLMASYYETWCCANTLQVNVKD